MKKGYLSHKRSDDRKDAMIAKEEMSPILTFFASSRSKNRWNGKKIGLVGIMVVAVLQLTGLAQSVPELVSYQGVLSGATGQPLTNSMVKLAVNMYDASSGGNKLWGPQTFPTIVLQNGRFNSILGPTDDSARPISTAFSQANCYIGLTVAEPNGNLANSTELAPRQRLLTTPYAFHSKTITDNAITSAKIADGTVTSADIADGTISSIDLAANAVVSAKIQDGTILAADIASSAITSAQIQDGTIASVDIAANAISSAQIQDGVVSSADIADGTVTSADIADSSIQNQDISSLDANKLSNLDHLNASGGSPINAVYVNTNGNVGIGTATPQDKLHLHSTAWQVPFGIRFSSSPVNTGLAAIEARDVGGYGGNLYFKVHSKTGTNDWPSNGVLSAMTIQHDGNVGIGTTTPGLKLDVAGSIRGNSFWGDYSLGLNNYGTMNPSANVCLYSAPNDRDVWIYRDSCNEAAGSNWGIYHRQIDSTVNGLPANSIGFIGGGNSGLQAYICLANGSAYFAGNVGIGTAMPSYKLHVNGNAYSTGGWTGSDERWKKDITTLTNALDQVTQLRGVRYAWRIEEFPERNFDHEPQIGLVAQEVEPIVPEVVHTDQEGYKSVSYEKLTAVLIEAVKELRAENAELKADVQVLKQQVGSLARP